MSAPISSPDITSKRGEPWGAIPANEDPDPWTHTWFSFDDTRVAPTFARRLVHWRAHGRHMIGGGTMSPFLHRRFDLK